MALKNGGGRGCHGLIYLGIAQKGINCDLLNTENH